MLSLMPMIDVYAPSDLFPDGVDREIAEDLTLALLRAEGVKHPAAVQLNNTAAYIHRLNPKAVHTAGTDSARTVRIQVLTPPGATQAARTWVILSEAAEGGWGIAGTAFGREEFTALSGRP